MLFGNLGEFHSKSKMPKKKTGQRKKAERQKARQKEIRAKGERSKVKPISWLETWENIWDIRN